MQLKQKFMLTNVHYLAFTPFSCVRPLNEKATVDK